MEQKDFRNILSRYRQGTATVEERKVIDEWYRSLERPMHDQSTTDESPLEARLWSMIHAHVETSNKRNNTRKLILWCTTGVAASIVLALVVGNLIIGNPTMVNERIAGQSNGAFSWNHITNTKTISELIILPDRSKVTLGPGSKLKFSSMFNEVTREVYLEGEAFFEVIKNTERPFLVYANEVTTKVLGTSFTVKAFQQEKKVTIAVTTGRVSVVTNKKNGKATQREEIILTPNQQVVVDKEEKKISKMLVDKPNAIQPEEEVIWIRFEEAPVSEIFKELERLYSVEIVFDEKILSSCALTTVISDDDIYNRLGIVCSAIGASYVLENGKIIISSTGCN